MKLIATASGDADATMDLAAEWDDGYDSSWDVAYTALAPHPISALMPSSAPYKVRVRNASGHVAEAVLWVRFTEAPSCSCRAGRACSILPRSMGLRRRTSDPGLATS